MMTDPVGDMITRIRNAGRVRHAQTTCPASRLKLAVAKVLSAEGFVGEVSTSTVDGHPSMTIALRYDADGNMLMDGIVRISKPGRRVYVGTEQVPRVRRGLGVAVMSTSKGILSDEQAREQNVGGEIVCEVW